MKECALIGQGLKNDNIFDTNSQGNRDNCYQPYELLASLLKNHGYSIHTEDRLTSKPAFIIHMNAQKSISTKIPSYLLMLETPAIWPRNSQISKKYRKVFTWRDDIVDGKHLIKINFPNKITPSPCDGYRVRQKLCCMIAGNKTNILDSNELYSERVHAIKWFEQNAPKDFDLYGIGWDLPHVNPNIFGKARKYLWLAASKFYKVDHFPSYRGKVDQKKDILSSTRFSICYENVRDFQGYITEKIFDCFFSGCVPIYWGAKNISTYIPDDCFIDRQNFTSTSCVYNYIKTMDETTYIGYQLRIKEFLSSKFAHPFSSETFAKTIASTIIEDLCAND